MRSRVLGTLLLGAVLTAVVVIANRTGLVDAGSPGITRVTLLTARAAESGGLTRVQIIAENASALAGFQSTVRYDPARLRLTGVTFEKELSRNGRDLLPMGPVVNEEEGTVSLGAATCPVSDCSQGFPFDAERHPEGVSGRVVLATLTFVALAPGEHALSLEDVQLVDPQGNGIELRSSGATVTVD